MVTEVKGKEISGVEKSDNEFEIYLKNLIRTGALPKRALEDWNNFDWNIGISNTLGLRESYVRFFMGNYSISRRQAEGITDKMLKVQQKHI